MCYVTIEWALNTNACACHRFLHTSIGQSYVHHWHHWCSPLKVHHWCSPLMFTTDVHHWCSPLMFTTDVHHWRVMFSICLAFDICGTWCGVQCDAWCGAHCNACYSAGWGAEQVIHWDENRIAGRGVGHSVDCSEGQNAGHAMGHGAGHGAARGRVLCGVGTVQIAVWCAVQVLVSLLCSW